MRQSALLRSGKGLVNPSTARKNIAHVAVVKSAPGEGREGHFAVRQGVRCAGVHLIVDLHGAEGLDDIDLIEATLRRCVDAAQATLLHIHVHHFQPNGRVWRGGARREPHFDPPLGPISAMPPSTCSCAAKAIPDACIPVLRKAFKAKRVEVNEILRGQRA